MSETEELDPGQPRRRTNSRVMADAWKAWKDEQLSTTELEVQMIGLAANADLLQAKLSTAERRLERTCKWKHDNDYWETECGHEWQFVDGGPEDNGAEFCYACGGRLVIAAQEPAARHPAQEPDESEEMI